MPVRRRQGLESRQIRGLGYLGTVIVALGCVSACAPRLVKLPTDSGTPLPDFTAVHAQVSQSCAGAKTMTSELGLSGRAGGQRLRGRVLAGFERPASMRLEGVAPFGPPAFILVSRGEMATLLLPRDSRVVRGAKAGDILGALTGVSLAPADLQAMLTGCVVPTPRPAAGRVHANGWTSIDLEGGGTLYLRRTGETWTLVAARRGEWQIEYPMWQGGFPATVRLHAESPIKVDLEASLSQVEVNTDLDAKAFTVDVPSSAQPLTIEELRDAGPLRDR